MKSWVLVFLGGGMGAALRYGLTGAVHRVLPADFPYGTMAVNILGCLTIGVVMGLVDEQAVIPPALRLFLTIGVLGGFTTFSSFSYESVALLRSGDFLRAAINVTVTVFFCLLATIVAWRLVVFIHARPGGV